MLLTVFLLVGVLVAAHTPTGDRAVTRLQRFLEFYSGVFTLLALTAAVVAGVGAAQRLVPIRFRILFQAAHRATAFMAVGFLVAHILLKIMEAHATVIDTVLPFSGHGRHAVYVGLGTIASDLMIVIVATGVMRGRFVAGSRPWVWRTVHGLAYPMWVLAMAHGLLAGRTPKWWVTWSYVICAGVVFVAATSRLPRVLRDRRMVRARAPKDNGRPSGQRTRSARQPAPPSSGRRSANPAAAVPDEEFWASLRAEAAQANWIGDRR